MLRIDTDYNIQLTRGDTARLNVTVNNKDGQVYEMNSEDTLRLTVKKSYKLQEYVFQKVLTGGTTFYIKPEDTKDAAFGKYVYDIELTTVSGEVYTIIGFDPVKGAKRFEILEEATW